MLPRQYVGIIMYVRKLRYYVEQNKHFELRMLRGTPHSNDLIIEVSYIVLRCKVTWRFQMTPCLTS